jgi:hypothetical protein
MLVMMPRIGDVYSGESALAFDGEVKVKLAEFHGRSLSSWWMPHCDPPP